jgi:syntaxin 16
MDILPPRWIDVQDEVTEILASVTLQSSKLDKLHQKHVLPGFDDEDIKLRQEQEIGTLTQTITRGFRDCQTAVQRIEKMVKESKMAGTLTKGEETMARNICISLATRIQDVSTSFRKKQGNYLNSEAPYSGLGRVVFLSLTTNRNARARWA